MTGQSETKHTPGELYAAEDFRGRHVVKGDGSVSIAACYHPPVGDGKANAARIVLTWNCHDELVAALRQARAEIVAADVLGARNEAGFVTDMALWAGRAVATIDAALANAKASA